MASRSLTIYPQSSVEADGTEYFLARSEDGQVKRLGIQGDTTGFQGRREDPGGPFFAPLSAANAAVLRDRLPWLRPVPLGLVTSAGFGDRLGLATPGHVRAVRQLPDGADSVASIFAQQSVRENGRTGRTPQGVVDDAMWGLFQVGWRHPWGADADHLKLPADVEEFAAAGYTMFTIDPGDHVDDLADSDDPSQLESKLQNLPWDRLEDSQSDLERRYVGRPFDLESGTETLHKEALWRAAVKYGQAVAHTVSMYRHILSRMGEEAVELEVSVDETESPTSVAEHLYIASELRRLGVRWVSLAPRFVGRFEKGVDYIGDVSEFSAEFARHVAVARALGPYKLSLHSGSDKFSIYPIAAKLAEGGESGPMVHVKTAGTSYLEALRAEAQVEPGLFREILLFSRERYEIDRATYHISAELARVPKPEDRADSELAGLLDEFDARQLLHVTFGSVLERFGDGLLATLRQHEETYDDLLQSHFMRHLKPFAP